MPGLQPREQAAQARRGVALLPGAQQRQVDGAGEDDTAGEVHRVVHPQPDATRHHQHGPGGDGAADDEAAAVGVADNAGEEERPTGSEGGVAGGEAVAGVFGAVGDEVGRGLVLCPCVVVADGVGAGAARHAVEGADAGGVVFAEDGDVGARFANERFEQAFADLGRTERDEDDEQQRAGFATAVAVAEQRGEGDDAGEGDGAARGLGDEPEQAGKRDFVALPVPAGEPEGDGDEEEQGGDGEEAFGHGW